MLDWIHQTFSGARAVPIDAPRFAHPDLAESLSASLGAAAESVGRSRKRLDRGPKSVDELYLAARAAGGTAAFDGQDNEAAVAF
jgi:hypothetical protein